MSSLKARAGRMGVSVAAALGISALAFATTAEVSGAFAGRTAIANENIGIEIGDVSTVAAQGGITCAAFPAGPDGVRFEVVAASVNSEVPVQHCDVQAVVHNNGTFPVRLTGVSAPDGGPLQSWVLDARGATQTIPPGASVVVTTELRTGGQTVTADQVGQGTFIATVEGTVERPRS